MYHPEPEDVYYAAEQLLLFLDAETKSALTGLLVRARNGEKLDEQILLLLSAKPTAHQWILMAVFGERGTSNRRGYQSTSGELGTVDAQKWYCPRCSFTWRVNRAGQPIPPCPRDGIALALHKG